jgi:hypothetical protein
MFMQCLHDYGVSPKFLTKAFVKICRTSNVKPYHRLYGVVTKDPEKGKAELITPLPSLKEGDSIPLVDRSFTIRDLDEKVDEEDSWNYLHYVGPDLQEPFGLDIVPGLQEELVTPSAVVLGKTEALMRLDDVVKKINYREMLRNKEKRHRRVRKAEEAPKKAQVRLNEMRRKARLRKLDQLQKDQEKIRLQDQFKALKLKAREGKRNWKAFFLANDEEDVVLGFDDDDPDNEVNLPVDKVRTEAVWDEILQKWLYFDID